MPRLNPANLEWARKSAGLSLEEAAHAVGLSGPAAADRLAQMESGEREPTRRQIANMAKAYRRPLLAFYLDAPPRNGQRNRDLRRTRTPDESQEAMLLALIRDTYVRHSLLQNALEDEDEARPLSFVGSLSSESTVEAATALIEQTLEFPISEYRSADSKDAAFNRLRDAVERVGIYVLLLGNLGSHHSALSPAVFRGFSIAKPIAPFIVINDADARSSWSFTLMHELTHIFLGQSDISGYGSNNAVERFCDDVAANFLVKPSELESLAKSCDQLSFDDLTGRITTAARDYKVSRLMLAYNLWRRNHISKAIYSALADRFDREWRNSVKPKKNSKVNYYIVRRHRLGRGLIGTVGRMMSAGALTAPKAARVLGVKPANVGRLTSAAA